jgi:hypothetical protein
VHFLVSRRRRSRKSLVHELGPELPLRDMRRALETSPCIPDSSWADEFTLTGRCFV